MSKFTVEIETDNAWFRDGSELDCIALAVQLRDIAGKVERRDFHPGHTVSVMDGNGNRVGSWKVHQ